MLYVLLLLCVLHGSNANANITYCFDDLCIDTKDVIANVWFTDTDKVLICPQPYASCDVGKLVYDFCFDTFGYTGMNRSICANNLWRMHALKEQLLVKHQYPENLPSGINKLGFKRTNDWFEHTLYLPGVLAKQLIAQMGEEFLFAKPLRILEVGTYEGGSATWYMRYLMSHPESTITCVDPWSEELRNNKNSSLVWSTFNSNIALGISPDRIRIMRNDSILALATLLIQGEQFDHIYIDGSHAVNDVVADIALAWRMLAPGGLMTLDDIPWRNSDLSYYTRQHYSFVPEAQVFEYCNHIGDREHYKMEEAISAVVSNLPDADVVYCNYHLALKKRLPSV